MYYTLRLIHLGVLSAAMLVGGFVVQDASVSMGQETPSTSSVQTLSLDVLAELRDRQPEAAWKTMATARDQVTSIADIVYTPLPSAAAGLHRHLVQQSAGEQYDLLQGWTMPQSGRDAIRLLTTSAPTSAPPKVFARSLRERPRENTFAVAAVGPVQGLFCSGWSFVQAADELGRLARLRIELEGLVQRDIPGSSELLMLAHLAGSRGNLELVNERLRQRAARESDAELRVDDLHWIAIAAASTLHPETQAGGEAVLQSIVDRGALGHGIAVRPLARIAHAFAVQAHRGVSAAESLYDHGLRHWVSVSVCSAKDIERGARNAMWLTHEGHILHLAGGSTDVLLFRYPVIGEFDFICDTQEGGAIGTDGGLVYGGLQYQTLGRKDLLIVRDADGRRSVSRTSPFARAGSGPIFNRVSIRCLPHGCQFESNFHPVWYDDTAAMASPWLGLRSSGAARPVFRNFELTGNAEIPREVKLLPGDRLRGWQSSFFGESQPVLSSEPPAPPVDATKDSNTVDEATESTDWTLQAGVLTGTSHGNSDDGNGPGFLQYQRPLMTGDTLRYEFFAHKEEAMVHPALGRLAFLLEPSGVRVRWITSGNSEWTGLPADNAALEPLYRRGPRPLPFRANQWNRIEIQLDESAVRVALNDELVYQRPRESKGPQTFGLYRPRRDQEVRVREAILTGDWPEAIPAELLATEPQ